MERAWKTLGSAMIVATIASCVGAPRPDHEIQVWVSGNGGILSRGEFRGLYETLGLNGVGNLNGVSALAENHVYVATDAPSVVRIKGPPVPSSVFPRSADEKLNAVAATSSNHVWAAGNDGYIIRWLDFEAGKPEPWTLEGEQDLRSVSAIADSRVLVVGNKATFARFDVSSNSWQLIPLPQNVPGGTNLNAVFDSLDDVWIVGDDSIIVRASVSSSAVIPKRVLSAGGHIPSKTLHGVYAYSQSVWAVGDDGIVLHSSDRGMTWATQNSGTTEDLRGITGVGGDRLIVVGHNGTKLASKDGGKTWLDEDLESGASSVDRTGVARVFR